MIHRDDGYDVTFDQESIVVGSYRELSLGLTHIIRERGA